MFGTPSKKPKLIKDAATFVPRDVQATINYPAFEGDTLLSGLDDETKHELASDLLKFAVNPFPGQNRSISMCPRTIPYTSDKIDSINRAGRKYFEAYNYEFCIPTEPERKFVVMWDYEIGLVRITPFFKACKLPKTAPANSIDTNPGLRPLCFSITGGAIAAQGYWMPYECARAICVQFCHEIRGALVPVFGPSFFNACVKPDDQAQGSDKFRIDQNIISLAEQGAMNWGVTADTDDIGVSSPMAMDTGTEMLEVAIDAPRNLRSRKIKKGPEGPTATHEDERVLGSWWSFEGIDDMPSSSSESPSPLATSSKTPVKQGVHATTEHTASIWTPVNKRSSIRIRDLLRTPSPEPDQTSSTPDNTLAGVKRKHPNNIRDSDDVEDLPKGTGRPTGSTTTSEDSDHEIADTDNQGPQVAVSPNNDPPPHDLTDILHDNYTEDEFEFAKWLMALKFEYSKLDEFPRGSVHPFAHRNNPNVDYSKAPPFHRKKKSGKGKKKRA